VIQLSGGRVTWIIRTVHDEVPSVSQEPSKQGLCRRPWPHRSAIASAVQSQPRRRPRWGVRPARVQHRPSNHSITAGRAQAATSLTIRKAISSTMKVRGWSRLHEWLHLSVLTDADAMTFCDRRTRVCERPHSPLSRTPRRDRSALSGWSTRYTVKVEPVTVYSSTKPRMTSD
jgi:hypothetical protein